MAAEYLFSDIALPEGVAHEDLAQQSQQSTQLEEVTLKMRKCVISELQHRAEHFQETKAVMVFDACVKSDNVIPSHLREALVRAAHTLEENQPAYKSEELKSFRKVDLVDPNYVPLIYGRSRILTDRHVGLQDCIPVAGAGETLSVCVICHPDGPWYDTGYQQLPCDISLLDGRCQIVSYINDAHPVHHQGLYFVIEEILTRVVPLLNEALAYHESRLRIELPQNLNESADNYGFEIMFGEDAGFCNWSNSNGAELPEPFSESQNPISGDDKGANSLQMKLQDRGLQIIVRIESVELTPAKPEMAEDEWHLEGQPVSDIDIKMIITQS